MSREHDEQALFVVYARDLRGALIASIPNGWPMPGLSIERRSAIVNKMKAEGLLNGACDLVVFEARGGYFGLLIEMKADDGDLSDDQKKFAKAAEERGYLYVAAWGYDEARALFDDYMAQPQTLAAYMRKGEIEVRR